MNHTRTDELAAVVKATNRANAYAIELHGALTPILAPLVGKPILKADGTLLAKYAKLMPELPHTPTLNVYRWPSNYTLTWMTKACEVTNRGGDYGGVASYAEASVNVGEIDRSGVLTKLLPAPEYRTDYTVEEVLEKRRIAKEAKTAYDAAKNDCFPFGEGY